MSNDPISGNRWEPRPPPAAHDPAPYAVPASDLSGTANGGLRNRATRRRGLVGAAAALLFVGGGAGGYALAASTTDHGDTSTQQGSAG